MDYMNSMVSNMPEEERKQELDIFYKMLADAAEQHSRKKLSSRFTTKKMILFQI